jgi:hypothetical protein
MVGSVFALRAPHMRSLALIFIISALCPAVSRAAEAAPVAIAQKDDIRLLGKLNVNTATREELLQIPSLTEREVDQLLEARTRGPLRSLVSFTLPAEANGRLSLSGPSTLRRIRALPLEIYAQPSSATR